MTITELDDVRRPDRLTVALAGSRCWVSDALAEALTAAGDRVVRLDDDHAVVDERAGCGAHVVVHLASGPREVSLQGRSEPALETLRALHAARVDGARLVIASLPGNADHLAADEALAEGFRTAHDVDTVVVRVAECYGPGMPAGRTGRGGVLARMLDQALTTGEVVVDAADDEEHLVCFVDDAVRGLAAVVHGEPGAPTLVGPPVGVRSVELAAAVARATGTTSRVRARRRLAVVTAAALSPGAPDRAPDLAPDAGAPDLAPVLDLAPAHDVAPGPEGDVGTGTWGPLVTLAEGLARCLRAEPAAAPSRPVAVVDLREPAVVLGGDVA